MNTPAHQGPPQQSGMSDAKPAAPAAAAGRAAIAALAALPGLPRAGDEPIFAEPWQAQAFAMTLSLHEKGLFTWPEWADALARQITAAQQGGDADLGDTYYRHWLAALEALVAAKGASSAAELERHRLAWDHAADRTPHGAPIELRDEDYPPAAASKIGSTGT